MRKDMPFKDGPYLEAAFLCEKVLQETNGVKSAIRIIDRLTHSPYVTDTSHDMEAFTYNLTLLLKLKSGWARGNFTLEIKLSKPSGELSTPLQQQLVFEGEEDRGIDLVAGITVNFETTGIYWFEVYLNNICITKIPFRVIYMPRQRRDSSRDLSQG
ncbi:MAG: hypothetical protein J7L19_03655 [Dehalococcoidia bacterium]|nr:hypothetical protein [Dehalococcoidia bacterium]